MPARVVAEGGDPARLYERDPFARAQRDRAVPGLGSFVPHPPPNALLLRPLAGFAPQAAKDIWAVLLLAAYAGGLFCLRRALTLDGPRLALVGLAPTAALANALAYGQPYPLLFFLASAALWAAERGRWAAAGALLAPIAVLKLYTAPFLLVFLWQRRGRAVAGFVGAAAILIALSVAVLGAPVHAVYAREILPASLEGRIQDPYSPVWQSASSVARRLFEREPDLNPHPFVDAPHVARALGRALTVGALALAVLAASASRVPASSWAALLAGGLAAAPLTATYHFVLLVLPVAVLVARARSWRQAAAPVLLLAFAASSLPHYFHRWAWGLPNLAAQPRWLATLAILAMAACPCSRRRLGVAAGAALVAAVATRGPGPAPSWTRLPAGGYLQAEPIACGGAHAWLAVEAGAYVVRGSDGTRVAVEEPPRVPVCTEGRIDAAPPTPDDPALGRRFGAPARHARVSPDGRWTVAQVWRGGSWDIEVVGEGGIRRRLTDDAANETEPSWSADGRALWFASDRGRGLGATAIYSTPFGAEAGPREAGQVGHGVEELSGQHGFGQVALKAGLQQARGISAARCASRMAGSSRRRHCKGLAIGLMVPAEVLTGDAYSLPGPD